MKKEQIPFYDKLVKPYHLSKAVMAGAKYGFPGKKIRVIGVTGTNGKTTTSFLIWKMLNKAGHKTGLMTTVAWGGVGGNEKDLNEQMEHMTTVDSMTLNKRIKMIREAGAEFLVLEVTSHALTQFRILGVPIEIAVFTNLTHEHLDYHKTMEKYRKAKGKLFEKAEFSIINADDEYTKQFELDALKHDGRYITYGIKKGENRAKNVKMTAFGSKYSFGDIKIETKLAGEFNVYNSLAAALVGQKLGLTKKQIQQGILALDNVEGRMTKIDEGQNFTVIVDYAHTPDAFEKVFQCMAGHKGKIIVVHGGAGRRDSSTRSIRGEILGKNADIVIITEDDSRDEDPTKIAEEFVKGAEKTGKTINKNLFIELDRKKAIKKAIDFAKKGDLVLVLGKGHEKTILRADGPHKFEDIKVVKNLLSSRR